MDNLEFLKDLAKNISDLKDDAILLEENKRYKRALFIYITILEEYGKLFNYITGKNVKYRNHYEKLENFNKHLVEVKQNFIEVINTNDLKKELISHRNSLGLEPVSKDKNEYQLKITLNPEKTSRLNIHIQATIGNFDTFPEEFRNLMERTISSKLRELCIYSDKDKMLLTEEEAIEKIAIYKEFINVMKNSTLDILEAYKKHIESKA